MNAANQHLQHGGGVAYAICQAGGRQVAQESERWIEKNRIVKVGHVAVTTAGNIHGAKKIIHAVGPHITAVGPTDENRAQLRNAVIHSLAQAEKEGCTSIALPALSIGIFNYPVEEAATVLIQSAVSYMNEHQATSILRDIRFVLYDSDTTKQEKIKKAFERCLANAVRSLKPHQPTVDSLPPPPLQPSARKSPPATSVRKPYQYEDNQSGTPGVNPREDFKGAGAILFKFKRGKLLVLLGFEYRLSDRQKVLNPLGGQRDGRETPKVTAGREFWEESGKVIPRKDISNLLNQPDAIEIWFRPGLYFLYLARCPDKYADIDERYNTGPRSFSFTAEMTSLLWVPWDSLVHSVQHSAEAVYTVRTWRETRTYPLSTFLMRLLHDKHVFDAVRRVSVTTVIPKILSVLEREQQSVVVSEGSILDEDPSGVIASLQTDSWRLKLHLPTATPVAVSPVVTLDARDQDYIRLVNLLPAQMRASVVSVRRVNVKTRTQEHREEESRLGSKITRVIDPTFHGTPERWRATNIAFKGFDLNQRLNGRSCGNGVYTCTDINTPYSYTRGQGSILELRGILTGDDHSGDPIYVFRGEKQVLPKFIIDFAPDVGDTPENAVAIERRKLQEEAEKDRRQLAEELAEMAEKENEFREQFRDRYQRALFGFAKVVNKIKSQTDELRDLLQAVAEEDAGEIVNQYFILSKRLDIEKRQFRSPNGDHSLVLPIYPEKQALVDAINSHDVVIVSAATGSGKSTQLPQYLLDNVFCDDGADKRRVAVLEPKRVNAISLCSRVSGERGESMGMEVGYSVGLGDVCTSESTRIEFMTHGMFINRALDPTKLLRTYCAVVLDEAHDGSVDVDLCFALLRQCLEYMVRCGREIPFKVTTLCGSFWTKFTYVFVDRWSSPAQL